MKSVTPQEKLTRTSYEMELDLSLVPLTRLIVTTIFVGFPTPVSFTDCKYVSQSALDTYENITYIVLNDSYNVGLVLRQQ